MKGFYMILYPSVRPSVRPSKCYVKPMKDQLGVSPNNGNQGTPQGKEKILCSTIFVFIVLRGTTFICTLDIAK